MQRLKRSGDKRWYWLLLIPYVAMLWIPSFNKMEPSVAGVPFFYWYQFVWIAVSALIIAVVYLLADRGSE